MENRSEHSTQARQLPKLGYSRHEAAEILGISVESLDRLTNRGLLNPSRALHRPLYSIRELERFLSATTVAAETT